MATVQFSEIGNNGITRLDGAINNSTTSVIVDSVTALTLDTSTTLAYLTIIDASTWRKDPITNPEVSEIVKVTSISGNTCTVVRAQDGTTAKAFADNDIVELRNTAVVTTEIQNALTDGTDDLNIGALTASGDLKVESALPVFELNETDATTDEARWELRAQGGLFRFATLTDAGAVGTALISSNRVGSGVNTFIITPDTTFSGGVDVGGDLTLGASGVNKTWSKYIPASSMALQAANPPSASVFGNGEAITNVLGFDQTTSEFIGFEVDLGSDYDGSAITLDVHWTASSGTGGVTWQIESVAVGDDEVWGVAASNTWDLDDTLIAANDLHKVSASGTPDRAGTGTLLRARMRRNTGDANDTLTADALLIGVSLRYT